MCAPRVRGLYRRSVAPIGVCCGGLPGGARRGELAILAGQDAHQVAAHVLHMRCADHPRPFGLEFGVGLLDAAQQFLAA